MGTAVATAGGSLLDHTSFPGQRRERGFPQPPALMQVLGAVLLLVRLGCCRQENSSWGKCSLTGETRARCSWKERPA